MSKEDLILQSLLKLSVIMADLTKLSSEWSSVDEIKDEVMIDRILKAIREADDVRDNIRVFKSMEKTGATFKHNLASNNFTPPTFT